MPKPDYYHEKQISISGFKLIAGIDEVGRGTLAGPVVAGVIIIDINDNVEQTLIKLGVNDSKALTAKKRTHLYKQLIEISTDYSTGWASPKEIDKIGINPAIELSITRAIKNLKIEPDYLLIDALKLDNLKYKQTSIIKGDTKSLLIASASIVAKVERDKYMENLSTNYDKYEFKNNKGYGTKKHIAAIKAYGKSEYHRKSFKIKGLDY
tara:strand:- start:1755 stop:2381 length:627 start_codon:yes stop_codon:yes gene_type:complete